MTTSAPPSPLRLSTLVGLLGVDPDPDFPGDFFGTCSRHGSFYGVHVFADSVEMQLACRDRPDGCSVATILDAAGAPALTLSGVVIDLEPPVVPKAPDNRFSPLVVTRAGLANLPEPELLIDETIDRRTVALLAGASGVGKSFVALDWAACIATGSPWMGRAVRPGRVLYVVGEGAYGVHQRLSAWEEHRGAVIPSDALLVLPEAVQIADGGVRDEFLAYVAAEAFDLVVIDTLARSAVGLDENSARDLGEFIDAAEQIKRASGGTVLLVHHTGKDRRTVRGSSALEGAMDTVYKVAGESSRFTLSREKRKDGPRFDEVTLRLHDVLSSCVVIDAVIEPGEGDERAAAPARAYALIAVAHDDFAETKTVLKDTLVAGGFGRTRAYQLISALVSIDVLRNVGSDTMPRLRIDRGRAAAVGFPHVERFRLDPKTDAPDLTIA